MIDHDTRDSSLRAALEALARADLDRAASPAVESRLLAEVHAIAAARRRAYARTAAVAAALTAAMALPIAQLVMRPAPAATAAQTPSPVVEPATEFLPLIYSTVPVTRGQIVTLEVPQVAVASFGLSASDFVKGSPNTVLAEVLVGEDGLARAVRFVRPANGAQEEQPQ